MTRGLQSRADRGRQGGLWAFGLAAVVMALGGTCRAQAPAQPPVRLVAQEPPPGPPRPFHFPAVASRTLPNGLRVFVVADHRQPAISVALVLTAAGTSQDPPARAGLARMVAELLTQGTEKRLAREIAEAIDFVGGSLSASASRDDTAVQLTITRKDFDVGMDLLADVVLHPTFPQQELDRVRQQTLSALRVNYADAGYLASAVLDRVLYGPRGYGLPEDGTPASLTALTRDDLLDFYRRFYRPEQALLAFAGDITPEQAFAAAEQYFGRWSAPPAAMTPAATALAPEHMRLIVVDKPDAVQTQIRVGRPAIARNNPAFIPLLVTNRIFGGGYNSLLNTAVRVQKGLTYGAVSALNALRFGGALLAGTSTRTEETVAATRLVLDVFRRMAAGQFSQADLDLARDYLTGVYPIQIETPAQVAQRVLTVAEYGLPEDYNQTYPERIAAVTLEQVRQMARSYFDPARVVVVLVGNAAAFRDQLKQAFPDASYQEIPVTRLDLLAPELVATASSLPAPTAASLAEGHRLLEQALQAAGGPAIGNVKTVAFDEELQISSPQGPVAAQRHLEMALDGRVYAEISLAGGMTLQQAFDGQSGWMAAGGNVNDLPAPLRDQFRLMAQLARGLGLYRAVLAGTAEAQALGEESVQGQKLLAVQWNSPAGSLRLYVDPTTHLVVGERRHDPQGGELTELWSDFRQVDGVRLPFHIVVYQGATRLSEVTVQQARLNVPLDSGRFTKPQL